MKTGFQSQPAKQPLKPVFTLENGYARKANVFLQDDTFNLYFLLNFYIRASVTHQSRRTTYFVLFILTINLCFACLILSVVGRGKLAGLP